MSNLTTQEINHLIATKINGWTHDESIFYHDASGTTCYLADYCNSISHSLDLAKTANVGLAPSTSGWIAYSVDDPSVSSEDAIPGTAICLCILKMFDSPDPTESTGSNVAPIGESPDSAA
jgi:hypothetical protein